MDLLELKDTFVEFKNYECKFKDCLHLTETDCEVTKNIDKINVFLLLSYFVCKFKPNFPLKAL